MTVTPFGVAVIDGDRLSGDVQRAGQLACADAWLQALAPYIPVGGTVCDIGAALGDHTASYARMVGPSGSVHACEPYAPFLECLRYNAASMPNVTVHAEALGACDTRGVMQPSEAHPDNLGMTRLALEPSGPVRVTTLDRLAEAWSRLDFVKIDVEGSEPLVLDGARETLTRWHPVMLIEVNVWALYQQGWLPTDVYRRLRALGYHFRPSRPEGRVSSTEVDLLCLPQGISKHDDPIPTSEMGWYQFWEAVGQIRATAPDPFGAGLCTCPRCGVGTVTYDFGVPPLGAGMCSRGCLTWGRAH